MSEQARRPYQHIFDTAELAFWGTDFEPLDDTDEYVLSGSIRMKTAYDPAANSSVDVVEMIGLVKVRINDEPGGQGVLLAAWVNGDMCCFDTDKAEFFFDGKEIPASAPEAEVKLLQGLEAIISDGIF